MCDLFVHESLIPHMLCKYQSVAPSAQPMSSLLGEFLWLPGLLCSHVERARGIEVRRRETFCKQSLDILVMGFRRTLMLDPAALSVSRYRNQGGLPTFSLSRNTYRDVISRPKPP